LTLTAERVGSAQTRPLRGAYTTDPIRVGAPIGGYSLVRQIGEGGMGAVWEGTHAMLGRRAAIKVLLPEYSTRPEIVQRFFNEARAATAISDPGIVQVFDFGFDADGRAYIVMELLEGEALDQRVAKLGVLRVNDALRIMRQVASTLGAAHATGIVHRDLKPANVFLVRDPEVPGGERAKVLDFGIAKLVGEQAHVKTLTSAVMGTPTYMSPEQCRGAGQVDQRGDVYSMGCMLFVLLAGRPPFNAPGGGEIISMHLTQSAPKVSLFAPKLSNHRAIDALVARCLAKDPAARFASGSELAQAIGVVLSQLPATEPQLAIAAPRRRPRWWVVPAALAVVGVGAVVAYMELRTPADVVPPPLPIAEVPHTPPPQPVAKPAPTPAPTPAPAIDTTFELTTTHIRSVLTGFAIWAKAHPNAACPRTTDLHLSAEASLVDAWGHPLTITCTDQPADQVAGVRSVGPDGKPGTEDDHATCTSPDRAPNPAHASAGTDHGCRRRWHPRHSLSARKAPWLATRFR